MAKLKFKVGDRVRIKKRLHGHKFKIDEVVVIHHPYPDSKPPHYSARGASNIWFITDEEIEPEFVEKDELTFRPYPPPISLEEVAKLKSQPICPVPEKEEWEPKFPNYAQLILTVQVFRDYGNGWMDVCDDDGNCLKVSKKNLHKPIFEYFKDKEELMKSMKAACLKVAKDLAKANNTVTTLEIKVELRRDYGYYYWTQQVVSDLMNQFAGDGIFTYTDNGTYRIYSLATPATVAATAGPVSSSLSGISKVAGSKTIGGKRGRPRKLVSKSNGAYVISRAKLPSAILDPNFENVTIDGTLVTKSDIRAQKKSPKGYFTPSKIARIQYISVDGTNFQVI